MCDGWLENDRRRTNRYGFTVYCKIDRNIRVLWSLNFLWGLTINRNWYLRCGWSDTSWGYCSVARESHSPRAEWCKRTKRHEWPVEVVFVRQKARARCEVRWYKRVARWRRHPQRQAHNAARCVGWSYVSIGGNKCLWLEPTTALVRCIIEARRRGRNYYGKIQRYLSWILLN